MSTDLTDASAMSTPVTDDGKISRVVYDLPLVNSVYFGQIFRGNSRRPTCAINTDRDDAVHN